MNECRCDYAEAGGSGLWGIETVEPSCPIHGAPDWRDRDYREEAPSGRERDAQPVG